MKLKHIKQYLGNLKILRCEDLLVKKPDLSNLRFKIGKASNQIESLFHPSMSRMDKISFLEWIVYYYDRIAFEEHCRINLDE